MASMGRIMRAGLVALIAGTALLANVAPASAAGAGATTNGYSNVTGNAAPTVPLCLPAPRTSITLFNTGTFNSNPNSINTRTQWDATEDYYFGPGGTYSDSQCTTLTAVHGALKVLGSGAHCDSGSGGAAVAATYRRVNSQYTIATTTAATCVRTGSPDETSNLTFTGTQLACDPNTNNCGDGSNSVEFTGSYTQG